MPMSESDSQYSIQPVRSCRSLDTLIDLSKRVAAMLLMSVLWVILNCSHLDFNLLIRSIAYTGPVVFMLDCLLASVARRRSPVTAEEERSLYKHYCLLPTVDCASECIRFISAYVLWLAASVKASLSRHRDCLLATLGDVVRRLWISVLVSGIWEALKYVFYSDAKMFDLNALLLLKHPVLALLLFLFIDCFNCRLGQNFVLEDASLYKKFCVYPIVKVVLDSYHAVSVLIGVLQLVADCIVRMYHQLAGMVHSVITIVSRLVGLLRSVLGIIMYFLNWFRPRISRAPYVQHNVLSMQGQASSRDTQIMEQMVRMYIKQQQQQQLLPGPRRRRVNQLPPEIVDEDTH